jgi:outer membrane protein TolC
MVSVCLLLLAQAGVAPMELTLEKAVDLALAPDGGTRMKLAREAVSASDARSRQALAALLPNVDGYMSYVDQTVNLQAFGLTFVIPGFGQTPSLVGPFSVFDLRAQASQSVFDLAAIRRYQAGRRGAEQARQEVSAAQDFVIERVARIYLAGLRAQASVESAAANLALSRALVKLAESQKSAGMATGIEVTRAQVQLANEEQRLALARNEYDRAALQLLREIGLTVSTPVRFADAMTYRQVEISADAPVTRADLEAQRLREDVVRLNYESVKWERLPSLVASGNYGTIGPAWNDAIPTRAVGVTLRVPLFDGGRRDARRGEAASAMRAEQIRTRDLQAQIELERRLAVEGLRAADAQVAAAREGLALADQEVAQAQRRYEAGVANPLEVTDAQTRLARARDNWIGALYSHNAARLDYTAAMGTISDSVRGRQ